jgi:serine/threonine protein phosphatase PrpC
MPAALRHEGGPQIDFHGQSLANPLRSGDEKQFLIAELSRSMAVVEGSLTPAVPRHFSAEKRAYLLVLAGGFGVDLPETSAAARILVHYLVNVLRVDIRDEMDAVLERCHSAVRAQAAKAHAAGENGCSLTMAYLLWPRLHLAHAGDGRCYLLRGSRLEQLTDDVGAKGDGGACGGGPQERSRRRRSWMQRLLRLLRGGPVRSPLVYKEKLKAGDTLLLATGGLARALGDREIAAILEESATAAAAAERLVDAAAPRTKAGESLTAVVAKFA